MTEFKIGDDVYISSGGFGRGGYIAKVDGVTPAGNLKVGKLVFKPDGTQRGGDEWHPYRMILATDKHRQIIAKRRLLESIQKIDFAKLSISQLTEILLISQNKDEISGVS